MRYTELNKHKTSKNLKKDLSKKVIEFKNNSFLERPIITVRSKDNYDENKSRNPDGSFRIFGRNVTKKELFLF